MSEIIAIETRYKGFRFRSRLEARWALFFDRVGVPWSYEVNPLRINGEAYLPDFVVTVHGTEYIHEVKPESSQYNIQPKSVYLAGKVSPEYEWRGSAAVSSRNLRSGIEAEALHEHSWHAWSDAATLMTMDDVSFLMVGPFPSSCDHGCAHSDTSRHLAETCVDTENPGLAIAMACSGAIFESDIFCAHIETGDAYGTLVEIGAALYGDGWYGRSKRVVCLTMDRKLLSSHPRGWSSSHFDDRDASRGHDLWLAPALVSIRKGCKSVMVDGREEARHVHSNFIRDNTSREYRLISTIGQQRPAVMTFGDPLNVCDKDDAYHNFAGGDPSSPKTPLLPLLCRQHSEAAAAVRAHRFDGT